MNINTPPPANPTPVYPGKPPKTHKARKALNPFDFFPTPREAVEAILEKEQFPGSIWEPCAGWGHLTQGLLAHGYTDIWETDIQQHNGYPLDDVGDFLKLTRSVDNIVTNPPYGRTVHKFVEHALKQANNKVAMLLPLPFLESSIRAELFDTQPPARVWIFRKRLTFYPFYVQANGKQSGGKRAYAWFVWDTSHSGRPAIDWL